MKVSDLAVKMLTTQETLSTRLYRDTFSYDDFVQIMDLLDCDVQVITRDTKKMF